MLLCRRAIRCRCVHPAALHCFIMNNIETITAVYRTIWLWFKRNLCSFTTFCADNIIHFAARLSSIAAVSLSFTAFMAASRFILESFFRIKFLFPCSEYEFFAAVLTCQCLVLIIHLQNPLTFFKPRCSSCHCGTVQIRTISLI
mgnify:CR=1 FL=1